MPKKLIGCWPDSQDSAHGRGRASACRRCLLSLTGWLGLRDAIKRRAQVTRAGTRPRHGPRLARAKGNVDDFAFAYYTMDPGSRGPRPAWPGNRFLASPMVEWPVDFRLAACARTRTDFRTHGPIREPCDGLEPTPRVVPMGCCGRGGIR